MRAFVVGLKRVANYRSLLPIIMITALCFFSHSETGSADPPTLIEHTFDALTDVKTLLTYQRVIGFFDNSYWFYIIAPVILSFSAVSDFSEEWFGGGFYLNIHRQQIFKYTVSKAFAYSLHSVLCFIFGVMLFVIPTILIFPCEASESILAVYPEGFWYHILSRLLNSAALAAIYPVFCIPAIILIKERFLSLSCPMLLNYVTGQVGSALLIESYNSNKPIYEKISMLMPYMQSKQYGRFEAVFGLPLIIWYVMCAVCFLLLTTAVYLLIKGRVKTGA